MKKLLLATLALTAPIVMNAHAEGVKLKDLMISDAFARATAGQAKNGGGFLTIMNNGQNDKLIAANAPIAKKTELHTHIKDGDIMRMRKIEAIEIASGNKTMLKPGGHHVMFMGLKKPLKKGETFPLELTFEKAGKVTVTVNIGAIGAMKAGMGAMDHSKMDHSKMDKMKKDMKKN